MYRGALIAVNNSFMSFPLLLSNCASIIHYKLAQLVELDVENLYKLPVYSVGFGYLSIRMSGFRINEV